MPCTSQDGHRLAAFTEAQRWPFLQLPGFLKRTAWKYGSPLTIKEAATMVDVSTVVKQVTCMTDLILQPFFVMVMLWLLSKPIVRYGPILSKIKWLRATSMQMDVMSSSRNISENPCQFSPFHWLTRLFFSSLCFLVWAAEWIHRKEGDVSRCCVHEFGERSTWRAALPFPCGWAGRQHCTDHFPWSLSKWLAWSIYLHCWLIVLRLVLHAMLFHFLWMRICWVWRLLKMSA